MADRAGTLFWLRTCSAIPPCSTSLTAEEWCHRPGISGFLYVSFLCLEGSLQQSPHAGLCLSPGKPVCSCNLFTSHVIWYKRTSLIRHCRHGESSSKIFEPSRGTGGLWSVSMLKLCGTLQTSHRLTLRWVPSTQYGSIAFRYCWGLLKHTPLVSSSTMPTP